ncbi:MAG: hypothetical protein WA446_20045 [Steroidobacteraceae bacterium]
MADQIVSGDSKEAVAYALLLGIAQKEGKTNYIGNAQAAVAVLQADEQWVLDTYRKCLNVVNRDKP